MSTSRHLLLLACTHALVSSCAVHPELARSQPAVRNMPRPVAPSEPLFVEPRSAVPPVANPYAPVRSLTGAVYSWQSEKRVECAPETAVQKPEAESALEPSPAQGMLAAFPERPFDPGRSAPPVSPNVVVAGLRLALHQCFSRWLEEQADAQGSVHLALELGCAGEVEAISAENQGVDESTLACLFSALAPARFAPPAGGHATVHVPVVFKNAAR
jgi:hypothetical protein